MCPMCCRAMALVLSLCAVGPALAGGLTDTTFTYQGRLDQNAAPAKGAYDLVFSLWNAPAAGVQIGSSVTLNDVQVTDGLFTVSLDFGASSFNGEARWLNISVNGTSLAPRQPITAAPLALQARGIFVNDDKTFVGIGRTDQVTSAELFGLYRNTAAFSGMYIETAATGEPFYGYSAGGDVDAYHYFDSASNQWRLNAGADRLVVNKADGFVGINTLSPVARLHVAGSDGTTLLRVNSTGSSGTALIVGTALGTSKAAAFSGNTSNSVATFHNNGSGEAAAFTGGDVTITSGLLGVGTTAPTSPLTVIASSGSAAFCLSPATGLVGSTSSTTAGSYGVFCQHPAGSSYGVWASGNLGASGVKSFRIDHPLDPQYKYLIHYCSESPEPLNVYSGTIALDENGEAWVELPDYFEHINRDLRYQLTCIGGFANVYIADEVKDNRFRIAGGQPGIKVSWEVKGVRCDEWVRRNGAPTVVGKPEHLRGLYLHPEHYGRSDDFAEHAPPPTGGNAQP